MPSLYPLRFQPVLRRYVWGGERLGRMLNKPVGDDPKCAESWEVVDHGLDQSIVAHGALAGASLAELVQRFGNALLGSAHRAPGCLPGEAQAGSAGRFPLLFKFLDAAQPLSVQVHPNDEAAARLDPPDLGKTEAWVILDSAPGSLIYAGLAAPFDPGTLRRAMIHGEMDRCLHRFEPNVGDCILIPAGTVHALGAGLLVAEIQQASDTTFRLFDWNRLGDDGNPRELHLDAGLAVIDYKRGPVHPSPPQPTKRPHVERLVACEKFVLDRWTLREPRPVGSGESFHLLAVLSGSLRVEGDPADVPLAAGGTILLPAALSNVELTPVDRPAVFLDAQVP